MKTPVPPFILTVWLGCSCSDHRVRVRVEVKTRVRVAASHTITEAIGAAGQQAFTLTLQYDTMNKVSTILKMEVFHDLLEALVKQIHIGPKKTHKHREVGQIAPSFCPVFGASNNIMLLGDCSIRGGEILCKLVADEDCNASFGLRAYKTCPYHEKKSC